ncbi:MAG: glutamine cyclotransferase [Mariniblastus sp.]|jgi:glutamine cyclotransferase
MRWGLIALFLLISVGGTYLAVALRPKTDIPRYTYEIIKKTKHDATAFTQGLVIADGVLWESTGRYGESSIRKIDLKTGDILAQEPLDDGYFGEGLTVLGDQLIQLTWKSGKAFIYDQSLKQVSEFEYSGEGWGLTSDGSELILSDGSSTLKFLDPKTYKVLRTVRVRRADGRRIGELNELEYAGGKVYANVYKSDFLYEIDPKTGDVTMIIELGGLWPKRERPVDGLLNGIAAIPGKRTMLVTGKLCPTLYEVRLVPVKD